MSKNYMEIIPRRTFMKMMAAAGGGLVVAGSTWGCQESGNIPTGPKNPNIPIPANDFSGDVLRSQGLLPHTSKFIPISSASEYETAFWTRLDRADYFQNNNYSVRFVEDWRIANNVDAVNTAILKDFTTGRASNPANDFLFPDHWETVSASMRADYADHQRLLTAIGENGFNGEVKIVGYYTDTAQRPDSNIIRQVFMVENNDKRYIIKVQNIKDALREAGAVIKLQIDNQDIEITNQTLFKLNKSPNNRVAITVSDALEIAPRIPAQTVESYITSTTLNEAQQGQLLQIYRVAVKSMMDVSNPTTYEADLLKLGNILVHPQTGNLVVADAFSSEKMTQMLDEGGMLKATNKAIQEHLTQMRSQLIKAGIKQEQIMAIEQALIAGSPESLSSVVPAGEVAVINIVDDVGNTIATAPIKNNMDATSPIAIPKRIPLSAWEKLTGGMNIGLLVIGGVILVKELLDKVLSFDEAYEVPMGITDTHNLRGTPYDVYEYYADGTTEKDPYFLAMTTYTAKVNDLKNKIERHRWAMYVKEGLGFSAGNEELQLMVLRLGAGVPVPVALESRANLDGSSALEIISKSPVVAKDNDSLTLNMIRSEMTEMYIDPVSTPAAQQQFDQLDQILSDEINIYWPTGEKWHVLDKMKQLYDEGMIDFWTLAETGHIIYGYQTGENIEFRYLAHEDSTQSKMYNGNDGKLHFPKKAVTINDLITM